MANHCVESAGPRYSIDDGGCAFQEHLLRCDKTSGHLGMHGKALSCQNGLSPIIDIISIARAMLLLYSSTVTTLCSSQALPSQGAAWTDYGYMQHVKSSSCAANLGRRKILLELEQEGKVWMGRDSARVGT